jgi:hypothetical protein
VGATTTLSATIAPADATDRSVKWSSKNPSRATVDPVTGVVTGVSAGTVLIAATANDKSGVETTKSVTVLSATRVQAGPITGVTSPKAGAAPSRGINGGTGYTAYLAWISSPSVFAYGTRYTAEITLTATPGFTFSGGYANNYQVADFKVNGNAPEWVANDGKTLKLRVWFPITESAPLPVVTIESQPAPTLTFTEGAIQGSLSVVASATQGATPNYEWFWSTQNVNTGGTATGYLGQTYTLPADLPVGTRYYYCSVGALSPTGVQAKRVSSAVAVVTVLPHTYAISVSEPVTFGSLQTPYTQPEPQTVTITNSGTGEVTLTQPSAINYIIGNLSPGVKIAKGGTATFTIQPKADLEVGDYNETIFIEGMKDVTGSVTVQFTVTAASGNDITYGPGNNDTKW